MRVLLAIGLSMCGLLWGCESDGGGDGDSCNVTRPAECPSDAPTYADVEPIFQERCVGCHTGDGTSVDCPTCWGLTNYEDIEHWSDPIRDAMLECEMPPVSSGKTMTTTERMEILEWIRCGAPE